MTLVTVGVENGALVELYYEDRGPLDGPPVVLIHGWPLSGRSGENPVPALIEHLDLSGVTLVGFSMGGGELVRYIGTYGTSGIAKAVLAAAVPPYLYKIDVPTLIIHGDSDGIVSFEVSGKRSHELIAGSELVLVEGGPHGLNATQVKEFNEALLAFLAK